MQWYIKLRMFCVRWTPASDDCVGVNTFFSPMPELGTILSLTKHDSIIFHKSYQIFINNYND